MYLKKSYFQGIEPCPADKLGQGYLTVTVPMDDLSDLPPEMLKAAAEEPELLDQFLPAKELLECVAEQLEPESFKLFRNGEVAFDGLSDCGCLGYGLDIAFSDRARVALVIYTGPGLAPIVKQYPCTSAEEAAALWQDEWGLPLVFFDEVANDNHAGSR